MSCQQCRLTPLDGKVTDSRPYARYVRRRRKCYECGTNITTVEIPLYRAERVDVAKVAKQCEEVVNAHCRA